MISNPEVLKSYSKTELLNLTSIRKGETKLGEVLQNYTLGTDFKTYQKNGVRYVILGVPESVGALANGGRTGAENAWKAFLSFFLNVQHNRFMDASQVLFLGQVQVSAIQENASDIDKTDLAYYNKLRRLCERIDEKVIEVLKPIFEAGLIPIIIGGGHNNAYPIIHSYFQIYKKAIRVINCDPHADFRVLEGRHSGNSFSYAMEQGYLKHYHVLGLHQNYNAEEMLARMDAHQKVSYTCYEVIDNWQEQVNKDLELMSSPTSALGIELDMDAIAQMPASAYTSSGINLEQARYFVRQAAQDKHIAWLHLPEAAPTNDQENRHVGKALSYLVTDFIKHHG